MLQGQLESSLGILKAGPTGVEVCGFVVALFCSCLVFSDILFSVVQILSHYFRKLGHNYLDFFFAC